MLKSLLMLLFLMMFISCSDNYLRVDKDNFENKIVYIKDNRTGLCFAFLKTLGGYINESMTCVPCENISCELLVK